MPARGRCGWFYMSIEKLIAEKRPLIVGRWREILLDAYPSQSSARYASEKDPFANPVGHAIEKGAASLFDSVFGEEKVEKLSPFLDDIIRLRAIQDSSPAEALSFIFRMKQVLREFSREIARDGDRDILFKLLSFESRLDTQALHCFNAYSKCREKIYELRVNEVRNHTFRLLQQAGLLAERAADTGDEPEMAGIKPVFSLANLKKEV